MKKVAYMLMIFCCIIDIGYISPVNALPQSLESLPLWQGAEETPFAKMATIKTWVSERYSSSDKLMALLQKYVTFLVPQNPENIAGVPVNQGSVKWHGIAFPTLAAIELPFLQKVSEIEKKGKIKTLEIAAGKGFVSSKVPFAFSHADSEHYVNDLNEIANSVISPYLRQVDKLLGGYIFKQIKFMIGDILKIDMADSDTNVDNIKGNVSVIFAANLQHFFNPIQDQQFYSIIKLFLKDMGYAYLCAQTYPYQMVSSPESTKVVLDHIKTKREKGVLYPGFMEYTLEYWYVPALNGYLSYEIQRPSRPPETTIILNQNFEEKIKSRMKRNVEGEVVDAECKFRIEIFNYFTPSTYRDAINEHNKRSLANPHEQYLFRIEDSFFIDHGGNRSIYSHWSKEATHAAVIIQKVKKDSKEGVAIIDELYSRPIGQAQILTSSPLPTNSNGHQNHYKGEGFYSGNHPLGPSV